MQDVEPELIALSKTLAHAAESFCIGQIVQITRRGKALVDYPGNQTGPVEARSIVQLSSTGHDKQASQGIPVLLVFENQNPALPIIVGIIRETVCPAAPSQELTLTPAKQPRTVAVDGKTVTIDAKEEIILRCGKSSITLKKNGKIVVKGAHLLSRSSGPNRIKGASVNIN